VFSTGISSVDPHTALLRLPPGKPQEKLGTPPFTYGAPMDLSPNGRRGVVLVTKSISDIWLIKDFAAAMR
jgi:hypothetical protein